MVDYDFGQNAEDKIRCIAAICASTQLLHLARSSGDTEWFDELVGDLKFAVTNADEADSWDSVRSTPPALSSYVSNTTFAMTGNVMAGEDGFFATYWTFDGTSTGPLTRLAASAFFEQGIRTMTEPTSASVLQIAMVSILSILGESKDVVSDLSSTFRMAFEAYTRSVDFVKSQTPQL